jgi:hypothetical protein
MLSAHELVKQGKPVTKAAYFLSALKAGRCKQRAWLASVFAVLEDPGRSPPRAFDIIRRDDGYYFYLDNDEGVLEEIEIVNTNPGVALCYWLEELYLDSGDMINIPEEHTPQKPLRTTYGNALFNYLTLVLPLGDVIPFQVGSVNLSKIESILLEKLRDDPEEGEALESGTVSVSQYQMFGEYALSLVACNDYAVQSVSRKSLMSHPKARQRREELMKKYAGQLNDPAVIVKIGQELQALDKEHLSNDPTMKFYSVKSGKYFGKVRQRLFYMYGGEAPFNDGTTMTLIAKSLEEGIQPEDLPVMINSLREGSFYRGAQTQLGGESTKTIYRMIGTSRIGEEDCGTKLGIPFIITPQNRKRFEGFWAFDGKREFLTTQDTLEPFVNKVLTVRSPMTCKTAGRNKCARCMGTAISEIEDSIPSATAQLGGRFLSAFLAAVHGKELKTRALDLTVRLR